MVMLADSFDARLTIEFTPQWAETILATPDLLSQVRGWQAAGHEIAAHHHAISYATGWDGYTNHPQGDILFPDMHRWDMQDFFDLMCLLAGDSLLLTGCITDHIVDWPAGLPYRTDGHMMAGALTQPQSLILNGQPVTSLGFGLINSLARVDSAKALFLAGAAGDVLGVVLHESNFDDDPRNMCNWLKFLAARGAVKTVRTILRERGYASGAVNSWETASGAMPGAFHLEPVFPNPFNGSAAVVFRIPSRSPVRLSAYDARGRELAVVAEGEYERGSHTVSFRAHGWPSGSVLFVLNAGPFRSGQKAVLLR